MPPLSFPLLSFFSLSLAYEDNQLQLFIEKLRPAAETTASKIVLLVFSWLPTSIMVGPKREKRDGKRGQVYPVKREELFMTMQTFLSSASDDLITECLVGFQLI